MSRDVLSITQVNEYIRSILDRDGLLANVAVRGEISNYKMRSEEHTSELQSRHIISYAVFCLDRTRLNSSHAT